MHPVARLVTRVLLLVALLGLAAPVQAYLDPSTGSMVISAIVGIFASIALAVKTYWYRLKALFRPRKAESEREGPDS